jgi:GNAT superfamily N-acetyltransferase
LEGNFKVKTCYIIKVDKYRGAIADLYAPGEMFPKWWCISRINVPVGYRGQGFGTKLLKEITDDADKEGETLALEIIPSGDLGYDDLEAWYRRNGFKQDGKYGAMVRRPISERRTSLSGL